MSLSIGPRPSEGHQYANAVALTFFGRVLILTVAMSPDHAWCSHSAPLASCWYSLVSNLRFRPEPINPWIARRAASTACAFERCSRLCVRGATAPWRVPSCSSSSIPTRPEIFGPSIHIELHGLENARG